MVYLVILFFKVFLEILFSEKYVEKNRFYLFLPTGYISEHLETISAFL